MHLPNTDAMEGAHALPPVDLDSLEVQATDRAASILAGQLHGAMHTRREAWTPEQAAAVAAWYRTKHRQLELLRAHYRAELDALRQALRDVEMMLEDQAAPIMADLDDAASMLDEYREAQQLNSIKLVGVTVKQTSSSGTLKASTRPVRAALIEWAEAHGIEECRIVEERPEVGNIKQWLRAHPDAAAELPAGVEYVAPHKRPKITVHTEEVGR